MPGERALNAFLKQYLEDQSSGRRRDLADYQADFPGNEAQIAEWYERYEGAGPGSTVEALFASVERIGPYRVVRELGRGGQGVVYMAEDDRLHRKVAIKVLTG